MATQEPAQELTFGQKAQMGVKVLGAFARNPKALVAVVKYKVAERKQRKAQPEGPASGA
ncbi:hypothetical protein [Nocardia jejuensis]|uniref:hypothetical protein n=1 Tax=Nocardia jejuensis TaxID=328049 RepID=UPI000B07FFCA|nr:hypothetical protein [Nocardia jejuensis]